MYAHGTVDQTQGSTKAELPQTPTWNRVFSLSYPDVNWTCDASASASHSAEMTSVCLWTQLCCHFLKDVLPGFRLGCIKSTGVEK